MKRKYRILICAAAIIALAVMVCLTMLFHPRHVNRIVVALDGQLNEADELQLSEILSDFNGSWKHSDRGGEPWNCGIDEEIYCVFFYNGDDLLYSFAPVLDGCASFECCYNAHGSDHFYLTCEKAKRIVDTITGNPYYIGRY